MEDNNIVYSINSKKVLEIKKPVFKIGFYGLTTVRTKTRLYFQILSSNTVVADIPLFYLGRLFYGNEIKNDLQHIENGKYKSRVLEVGKNNLGTILFVRPIDSFFTEINIKNERTI